VSRLRIGRSGGRDGFAFVLEGDVDPGGARALDRLLLECQARDAREVRLEFADVAGICALGLSVLSRWGRVYESTGRRILVGGLTPALRAPLVEANAVFHESGASAESTPGPPPGSPAEAPAGGAPEAASSTAAGPPPPDAALAEVQTKLRRKVLELRNLFDVTQALILAEDLDETMRLFSLHLMGQFGMARLALFLCDPDRDGTLLPRHARGFPAEHFRDFAIPARALGALAPERVLVSLEEPADGSDGVEGVEALLQSGFQWGVPLWVRRQLLGAVFLGGRAGERPIEEDERELLAILANQAAIAIAHARNQRALEERYLSLVRGMMALIESRDVYAKGSTERVVRYVTAVARLLDVPKPQLKSLIYGAVLRDIGMIMTSQMILKNPAHLTDEEWAQIREHPVRGAQILEEMNFPREVVEVVRNHHERWGGDGYPAGIRGADIPLGARIVALVDAYVAMTAERPYRRSLPHDKARRVIAENWGTPFDPAVVEAFLAVLDRLETRSRRRRERGAEAVAGADTAAAETNAQGNDTTPAEAALDPLGAGATIPLEVKP
jgi:putative nucleotidyltransferase with HDIG domain